MPLVGDDGVRGRNCSIRRGASALLEVSTVDSNGVLAMSGGMYIHIYTYQTRHTTFSNRSIIQVLGRGTIVVAWMARELLLFLIWTCEICGSDIDWFGESDHDALWWAGRKRATCRALEQYWVKVSRTKTRLITIVIQ